MATRVKICGLNTSEALAVALAAGADYVGLVFYPPSPRNVDFVTGRQLADTARGRARIVALTVDADDALLQRIVREVRPDMIQLHGLEPPARVAAVKALTGLPVIKALRIGTSADAEAALAFAGVADLVLFDARPPQGADRPGGHGQTFDWQALDVVKGRLAFMLSGGLTPDNVAEAIRVTGAESVDVSSGVESRPGVKDAQLIRRFVAAVRAPAPARACCASDAWSPSAADAPQSVGCNKQH